MARKRRTRATLPENNLPDTSVRWGRQLENRTVNIDNEVEGLKTSVANLNKFVSVVGATGGGSGSSQTKDYIPVWGRRVGYTSQSIPNAVNTTVSLNDETEMRGGLAADGAAAIRIEEAGWYRVHGSVSFFPLTGATTVNYLQLYIVVNGVGQFAGQSGTSSSLAEGGRAIVEDIIELQAGDIVYLQARHSTGATRTISVNADRKSVLLVEKTEPKVAIQGIPTPLTTSTHAIFDTVAQMHATSALEMVTARCRDTGLEYIRKGGVWLQETLPPPKKNPTTPSVINVAVTSWARLNDLGAIEYNLDRPMYCEISMNAWVESSSSGLRAGLQVVGDNISLSPQYTNMGNPVDGVWGSVMRRIGGQPGQSEASRVVILQPGYNEISAWAYREVSSGTHQVNYASFFAKPLGWAD